MNEQEQSSLFAVAGEGLSELPGGIDSSAPAARPTLSPTATLTEWIVYHRFDSALDELVLRAKTIEANHIISGGNQVAIDYLRGEYDTEESLKAEIQTMGDFIHRNNLILHYGENSKERLKPGLPPEPRDNV